MHKLMHKLTHKLCTNCTSQVLTLCPLCNRDSVCTVCGVCKAAWG